MKTLDILQTTRISVQFYDDVDKNAREELMDAIVDKIYEKVDLDVHPLHDNWYENKNGKYTLVFEEHGDINYYPKSDDYDSLSALDEDEYEKLIDYVLDWDDDKNINIMCLIHSDWAIY